MIACLGRVGNRSFVLRLVSEIPAARSKAVPFRQISVSASNREILLFENYGRRVRKLSRYRKSFLTRRRSRTSETTIAFSLLAPNKRRAVFVEALGQPSNRRDKYCAKRKVIPGIRASRTKLS